MKVVNGGASVQAAPEVEQQEEQLPAPDVASLEDVVALCHTNREPMLAAQITNNVHLVKFAKGLIEIRLTPNADRTLTGTLTKRLSEWTGERWVVSVSNKDGQATLADQQKKADDALKDDLMSDKNVSAILHAFPGAEIISIK